MDSAAMMTRARTRLLLDAPWFGALAMRLQMVPDPSIPTMMTNGQEVRYNPDFAAKLPEAERMAVLAHEVMHCALLHPFRRGSRDHKRWNVAADYAINHELRKSGFQLPKDALFNAQYAGMSADVIYAKLGAQEQQQQQQQQGGGGGQQQGGRGGQQPDTSQLSTGSVNDSPQPGKDGQGPGGAPQSGPGQPQGPGQQPGQAPPMTEADWKIAAEQATAVANAAGKTPGGADRLAKMARASRHDWISELREFVEHTQPSDFSWSTPNRRHIADGLYLPGIVKENVGVLAVGVDTSGSVSQSLLDVFARELTAIVQEARPERVDVLYCDTNVRRRESFSPDDDRIVLRAKGGGGTRLQPVFDALKKDPEPPIAAIYFTDLLSSDTPVDPGYPVLWVTPLSSTLEAPFGRTVRVDEQA